jgi:hypothetical protein
MQLDYKEFMQVVIGDLSGHRNDSVELAWRRINPLQAPKILVKDVKSHYNASRHPLVKSGERSEDSVRAQFEEVLESHHLIWNGDSEGPVSKDEFFSLHKLISFCIAIDDYFDTGINGVWNVDVKDLNKELAGTTNMQAEMKDHRASWKFDMHRSLYGNLDHKTFEHE